MRVQCKMADSSQLILSLFLDLTTEGGTCCVVESNGQDYRADVETDIEIDDVLRFDNANFSSCSSLPHSTKVRF